MTNTNDHAKTAVTPAPRQSSSQSPATGEHAEIPPSPSSSPSSSASSGAMRVVAGVAALVALVAVVNFRAPIVAWFTGAPLAATSHDAGANETSFGEANEIDHEIDHYTCSMHTSVHQARPGKCPICGMELVPVSKAQMRAGVVHIDAIRQQQIGVKLAPVIEAPMTTTMRAFGQVAYDESKLTDVTWKSSGFVTKLFATETGRHVKRGQPLALLYSPDVYAAERDFLLAAKGPSSTFVDGTAARTRLRLLGLGDAQIDAVAAAGKPDESVTLVAPADGNVIEKNIIEGASFESGARLFRIAALDEVWVDAAVYASDLAHVHVGDAVTVSLDDEPDRRFDARVAFIAPVLDASARTGRVRVTLKNADGTLKPGMFATVSLSHALGERLQLPSSAVVYAGPRRLVFVDAGDGNFEPREIELGPEANGMLEVKSGLRAGDVVATSGVFLIAAEARISAATTYWDAAEKLDGGAR
jgi:Cu(I)/Ag(I) efflux system membrane fusion protein